MAQSEQEILAGLAEIVNEETGLDPAAVQSDKSFTDDLDIDSLSMMTIVVNAEEKFGVRIPDDEVKNLTTVGDAVALHRQEPGLSPDGRPPRPLHSRRARRRHTGRAPAHRHRPHPDKEHIQDP